RGERGTGEPEDRNRDGCILRFGGGANNARHSPQREEEEDCSEKHAPTDEQVNDAEHLHVRLHFRSSAFRLASGLRSLSQRAACSDFIHSSSLVSSSCGALLAISSMPRSS